jgi:thermostable 8-oxoguanine DNA glycosylase
VAQAVQVETTMAGWQERWQELQTRYDELFDLRLDVTEELLQDEALFCLLGGHGVPYELALSATRRLLALDVFSPTWKPRALEARLRQELSSPQFEPRRRNDELRRYRYPKRKGSLIVSARMWFLQEAPVVDRLRAIDNERVRREFLCSCPGFGQKTASWLLRNLGLGRGLAIIDVHVLRALIEERRLVDVRLPRDYARVEEAFLAWCAELDASPAAFDLFLWEWQRGSLAI